jgi:hypothetical protein
MVKGKIRVSTHALKRLEEREIDIHWSSVKDFNWLY